MSLRTERVAPLIKEEIGVFFTREYRSPEYGFITVTEVQMTPDLRIAKIYVSIMGNDETKERTLALLEHNKPEIRAFIGSHARLKFNPAVQIYMDQTLDQRGPLGRLINQLCEDDPV